MTRADLLTCELSMIPPPPTTPIMSTVDVVEPAVVAVAVATAVVAVAWQWPVVTVFAVTVDVVGGERGRCGSGECVWWSLWGGRKSDG